VRNIFLVTFSIFSLHSFAQEAIPSGTFLQDSFRIGEPIEYALSAQYNKSQLVLFPDSTFDYGNFELIGKNYYPTTIRDTLLFDSAVYRFMCFELDCLQVFQLPVFLVRSTDSLEYFTQPDTVFFSEVIHETRIDTLDLKENTSHLDVPGIFNYPYLIILTTGSLLIALIVYFFFGNQIKRSYRLYRLKKAHLRFLETFQAHTGDIRNRINRESVENTLTYWKRYMENLEGRPYLKLTTRELKSILDSTGVPESLSKIDRQIYGGAKTEDLYKDFETLEEFSKEKYQEIVRTIKHGK
jgi:hypothetical protein